MKKRISLLLSVFLLLSLFGCSSTTDAASGNRTPYTTEAAAASTAAQLQDTLETIQPATEPLIPCTALRLTENSIQFSEIGLSWFLGLVITPANTTDTVTFISSDPAIATVSPEGEVTAVNSGTCIITVICGSITKEVQVSCVFSPEAEPTKAPTEPSESAARDYVLNTNTRKFHYPSCKSAAKIKASNRKDYHGTREEIIQMGYEPCKNCNP